MKRFNTIFALLSVLLFACTDGGGSGAGGGSTPPSISGLSFDPEVAYLEEGDGTTLITGQISFYDEGGDLSDVVVSIPSQGEIHIPVIGISGIKTGLLIGQFTISNLEIGNFPFDVWVTDSQGSISNKLSGSVSVVVDDRAIYWHLRTSGTSATLRSVSWSGDRFVAVGGDSTSTIVESGDGKLWAPINSTPGNKLNGVVWGGGKFIAVGDEGTIVSSLDGLNWSLESSSTTENLMDIAWSGTAYIAVGGNSTVLSSPDGENWTKYSAGIPGFNIAGMALCSNRLYAVGYSDYSPFATVVLDSADGKTWLSTTIPNSYYSLFDIACSNSTLVAAGAGGVIFTSSNGVDWQQGGIAETSNVYAAVWSGRFLTVGMAGGAVSTDGLTWDWITPSTIGTGEILRGVTWSGKRYVAVGESGTIVTSP